MMMHGWFWPSWRRGLRVILPMFLALVTSVVVAQSAADLLESAKKGDVKAQVALGELYAKGDRVRQDFKAAAYWFNKAARSGNADAQYFMGYMYANGFAVQRNPKFAAGWYQRAAKQGHREAQFALALLYQSGHGIRKDDRKALYWLRKAAEQWHSQAHFNLAHMYLHGKGVKQDFIEAYKWFELASQSGDRYSTKQKYSLAQRLPGARISEARRRAQAWMKQFPPPGQQKP